MGFIADAVHEVLWDCIKQCAKENNIESYFIRNLAYADEDKFIVSDEHGVTEFFKPVLSEYLIPNCNRSDFIQQMNSIIKEANANAIILGKVSYEPQSPFGSPITALMWFGRVKENKNTI